MSGHDSKTADMLAPAPWAPCLLGVPHLELQGSPIFLIVHIALMCVISLEQSTRVYRITGQDVIEFWINVANLFPKMLSLYTSASGDGDSVLWPLHSSGKL